MTKLEELARAIAGQPEGDLDDRWMNKARRGLQVLRMPQDAMLVAAREWSRAKYGTPIGNDAATGCWQAMIDAVLMEE